MNPVRFHRAAESEMIDAAAWYESQNEDFGKLMLGIRMTEESHCDENAKAERVNGILKQKYG